jgi:flavodoxin I
MAAVARRAAGARAGARRAAAGRGLVRADAVGVFFGTVSGKTEEVAGLIAEALGTEAQDISEVDGADSLAEFDSLVVGAPTWNTGADEQRTSTAWDDLFEEIDGLDLGGKPVAVFGLGDSSSYGDNFCDAIEEIHGHFASAGAKMVGYVSADGYTFDESKSVVDGQFLGLPLDEDSEDDLTEGRYTAWVEQIKGEGVN